VHFKRKIIILIVLIIIIWSFVGYLPGDEALIAHYTRNVFTPYQSLRGSLFGYIPFSIGDLLYVAGGIAITAAIIRWIYYAIKFGLYTAEIASALLNIANTTLFVYFVFIASWGANYYKAPLSVYWGLEDSDTRKLRDQDDEAAHKALRAKDSTALVTFDLFLIDKLNKLAPYYSTLSFGEINQRGSDYYRTYTSSKVKDRGLWVKPSLFGYFIERLAIEGYYNPFTGEGQVNTDLPAFIMPFVACHEMAHQAGIAAEGDANLVSYTLCTTAADTSFQYSAYLNIWIYTNNRLYARDSAFAHKLESKLNKLTLTQLDTLEQLSKKYHNEMARYSNKLYDGYLKMENQKKGVRSYGDVAISAWQVEQRRKKGMVGAIDLP